MPEHNSCFVCKYEPVGVGSSDDDGYEVNCKRCGSFWITRRATVELPTETSKLSAWIREQQEFRRDRPRISEYLVEDILKSLPERTVADKQRLLLYAIGRRSTPGKNVDLLFDTDYPLAWAQAPNELQYLVRALKDRGLVSGGGGKADNDSSCLLTPKGWDYFDEHRFTDPATKQVFVAMWFDKRMDDAWECGIKPALEQVGYRPVRVDTEPHLERIDAKIQADIKDSRFIVADVTGHRQGVYFEAGYAMGLGLPVVWSVKKDDLADVHFDTRQFNHIVWSDHADLKAQLENRVVAVIGRSNRERTAAP